MAIDLSEYNTVSERIAEAADHYPNGRFADTEILDLPTAFADRFIAVRTAFYRTEDDPKPGVGIAWEPVPGKTPYTRDSELQNAETSAWGRALIAALVADAKKNGIASQEEVRNRHLDPIVAPSEVERARLATNRLKADVLAVFDGHKDTAATFWTEALRARGFAETDVVESDAMRAEILAEAKGGS